MPYGHKPSGKLLHPISGIGGLEDVSPEDLDRFLNLGIAFLRGVLGEPPPSSELAIQTIEDSIVFERMIVLQFDAEPDGAEMYALRAEAAVSVFIGAVNWQALRKAEVDRFLAGQTFYTTEQLLRWVSEPDEDTGDVSPTQTNR